MEKQLDSKPHVLALNEEQQSAVKEHSDAIFRELHAEMRALRDTELKLIPLFFQTATFIVAANMVAIFSPAGSIPAICLISATSAIMIIILMESLCRRMKRDNRTYQFLGERVFYIRGLWGVAPFFQGRRYTEFGRGEGASANILMIRSCAAVVIFLILAAAGTRVWTRVSDEAGFERGGVRSSSEVADQGSHGTR